MRFFEFLKSAFCILFVFLLCLLAASVFNPKLSDVMKKVGAETLTAIKEFSEKAEVNVFSEAGK